MAERQRVLVEVITMVARERGIACSCHCHDWVIVLEQGERRRQIFGYNFDLNPAAAARIANDKAATSILLSEAGLPSVEHLLFPHPELFQYVGGEGNWREMLAAFDRFGQRAVLKPNEGTGGHGVTRVMSLRELEVAAHALFESHRVIALSPLIEIEREQRLIMLDGQCLLAYEKLRPAVVGDGQASLLELLARWARQIGAVQRLAQLLDELDPTQIAHLQTIPEVGQSVPLNWKNNLGLGASATINPTPDATRITLARRAMSTLNLRFGAVDLIDTPRGPMVLEINAGLMLETLARTHPEGMQITRDIYGQVVDKMFSE